MEERLSKEELGAWKQDPTTRKVFGHFKGLVQILQEEMADGRTIDYSSADQTLARTTFQVGRISGIREVLGVRVDEESEEE